ncbi:hypothetical protein MMC25_008172 [Agyrium rufum]|nr:hypothetical protein [Agyrium rufum]
MSMSLEAALDEERREIMELLEGRSSQSAATAGGEIKRATSPAPVVRSMLDFDSPAAPRHGSIAGTTVGVTSLLPSGPGNVRSMLDTQAAPPSPNFPPLAQSSSESGTSSLHRAASDAASTGRPRAGSIKGRNIHEDYQFGMTPTVTGQALPKRVSQGGKKQNSMASILQGQELTPPPRIRDSRGRHNSTAGILGGKSKSPSSRLHNRSQSPGTMLNTNSFNPMPSPGKFVTDGGKVIDMSSAYRRLSDANLLKSGGNLARLATQDASARARLGSGESLSPSGEVRMQKDYYIDDENSEGAVESSDEDRTSDEDAWGTPGVRGRRRRRKGGDAEADDDAGDGVRSGPLGMGNAAGPRTSRSLMAAAEEERVQVSSAYKVKSLLEPTLTITGPGGERLAVRKPGVHPNTNYNASTPGAASPTTSDSEDLSDIRRAQRLSVHMSALDNSIPNRVLRTILRGEFSAMQREAEEGKRRLRTYLVATDLSAEAAYALEWTIGTVLRDGDTLLAIYAVDEEVGTGKSGDVEPSTTPLPGESQTAIAETTELLDKLTVAAQDTPPTTLPSPLAGSSLLSANSKDSRSTSTDSRNVSKSEQERIHAVEDITQTCIKFLRKTKLQVRIAVEVIHCKSPKHMITGAIDGLEPTLVILGSRGRSALKGVLLGSFSNYLVTKSSVPVMVARKKLQKPNAKNRPPHVRHANNLLPARRLDEARIDELG